MNQILRHYDEAKVDIQPGDWLFCRCGWKPSNLFISRISGSPRVHVAMADRLPNGELVILHTLQWRGGERVLLQKQVEMYPGRWEHFVTNPDNRWPEWNRERAVGYMRGLIGKRYGWKSLALAGIRHAPFVRLFIRPDTIDTLGPNGLLPFCSDAVSRGTQWGGVDAIQERPNRLVDPGRLSETLFCRYRCTLVP